MGSFNATSVGLERMAGTLKHLPFAIDELQVLNNKRFSIENIIYSLGNGFGRLRGAKEGGIQETARWRNNIITSGEQTMSKESSNDGVLTRVLELYGKSVDDVNVAHTLHLVSENHYGFAGKIFIQHLINDVLKIKGKVHRDFDSLRKDIKNIKLRTAITRTLITLQLCGWETTIRVQLSLDKMKKKHGVKP